jgi:hypothetical protein
MYLRDILYTRADPVLTEDGPAFAYRYYISVAERAQAGDILRGAARPSGGFVVYLM